MKQIYQARDAGEAHLIRAELEARGIPAVVQGESLRGAVGEVPFFLAMPTVHVPDDRAEEALEIIEEYRQPPAPPGEPWECPECGEMIDGQFSGCWQCAGDDPDAVPPEQRRCRECGYRLRGLPDSGTCPECGRPY